MVVELFRNSFGKSTGALKLYDHCMGSAEIALSVMNKYGQEYPKQKQDMLVFSTFVHDLGKLDPDFQAMLQAVINRKPLPFKRVKHEASTLEYMDVLIKSKSEIKKEISMVLKYDITAPIDIETALAFAASHHGLFYISYEATKNYGDKWLIRREWTTMSSNEIKRITLVDLLFLYHPFGGIVMISDLIHSYCHEKGLDYKSILSRAPSYKELFDILMKEAEALEVALNKEEPRADRGLRALLGLLAGGVI
jgi:hypothetical protein